MPLSFRLRGTGFHIYIFLAFLKELLFSFRKSLLTDFYRSLRKQKTIFSNLKVDLPFTNNFFSTRSVFLDAIVKFISRVVVLIKIRI